jgi:hypothetical protein
MTPEAAPDDQDLWEHLYRSQEAVVIGLDDEQLTVSQPAHATIVAGSSIGSPSAKITNFHGGTHLSLYEDVLIERLMPDVQLCRVDREPADGVGGLVRSGPA